MPKVEIPDSKYAVTFNDEIGPYGVGDSYEQSIDFVGDYIDELADEVCTSDLNWPMRFVRVDEGSVVGVFVSDGEDENSPTALMYER